MRFSLQKKTESKSRSSLFLMELIISICFFAIASAVCIRLFVQAHFLSRDTVRLNTAVSTCQNIVELFYGCEGNEYEMIYLLGDSYPNVTDLGNGDYELTASEGRILLDFKDTIEKSNGGRMLNLVVTAYDSSDNILYALNAFDYEGTTLFASGVRGGAYEE